MFSVKYFVAILCVSSITLFSAISAEKCSEEDVDAFENYQRDCEDHSMWNIVCNIREEALKEAGSYGCRSTDDYRYRKEPRKPWDVLRTRGRAV
jgi:hypothetical protein